ncbi:MAG: magnesium transporter CorA family protein [Patescibacteria group bacterium]
MNNLKEVKHNDIRWINIESPDKEDIDYLRENFNFHPLDLEDVSSPTQRSKIDKYKDYIFIILMFPIYNRTTKEIEATEVDFFIGKDFLITINKGDLPPLLDLFQICQSNEQAQESTFSDSSEKLLYNVLKKLHLYCYPMLDHISLDIASIKKQIFKGNEKDMVKRILEIRRNITDYRKIMNAHEATVSRLLKKGVEVMSIKEIHKDYFDDLIDYTKEIWDQLESFKEAIEALQETNESLISFKLNDVMKILTIISVVLLPATVITSLFGINMKFLPFAGHPYGFFIILAITTFASGTLLFLIFRKHWMK